MSTGIVRGSPGVVTTSDTRDVLLRAARSSDLVSLTGLLNHEIETGTASWTSVPKSQETMAQWIVERTGAGFPVVVAEDDATVLGYGSYGPFRTGEGYGKTVEHTVYVSPSARRSRIATRLMERLISQAKDDGYHRMVGVISADQEGSLALHRALGFREVGHLPEVGHKFGRWLDLKMLVLPLG
ncbi:MAG: N-acetyltransferase family protein [Pseudomonadota bacterium]